MTARRRLCHRVHQPAYLAGAAAGGADLQNTERRGGSGWRKHQLCARSWPRPTRPEPNQHQPTGGANPQSVPLFISSVETRNLSPSPNTNNFLVRWRLRAVRPTRPWRMRRSGRQRYSERLSRMLTTLTWIFCWPDVGQRDAGDVGNYIKVRQQT